MKEYTELEKRAKEYYDTTDTMQFEDWEIASMFAQKELDQLQKENEELKAENKKLRLEKLKCDCINPNITINIH